MKKKDSGKKEDTRKSRPRPISGNLTEFISRYHSDADISFEGDIFLSVRTLPSDLPKLLDYIKRYPRALNAFMEHGLIIREMKDREIGGYMRPGSRKQHISIMKMFKIQAALLYRFLNYCRKENNDEYPEFLPYISPDPTKAKSAGNISPLKATALFMQRAYGSLHKKTTGNRFTPNARSFRSGYVDEGMSILKRGNTQKELDTLCTFTFTMRLGQRFDDASVFSILHDLNQSLISGGPFQEMNNRKTVKEIEEAARKAVKYPLPKF